MNLRLVLGLTASLGPLSLLSFLWDHPLSGWIFAGVCALFPPALMWIGSVRGKKTGPLAWILGGLGLLLTLSLLAILAFHEIGIHFLGVPGGAIALALGIWLLPQPLIQLGYAVLFDRFGLNEQDLEKVRRTSLRRAEAEEANSDAGS